MGDERSQPAKAIDSVFARRTLFQFAVAALLFLLWHVIDVVLFAFAAVLVAVLLRSLADPIRDHTPLNEPMALLSAGAAIVGVLAGVSYLFGSLIRDQITGLADLLPGSMTELRAQVVALPFGEQLASSLGDIGPLTAGLQGLAGRIGGYAMTAVGAVTNLVLIIFAGVFLALSPRSARDGLLVLIPKGPREPIGDALDASGVALRRWLVGTAADMVIVGVLTTLGAWIVGLPSPLALGLLAGVATFVPIVGPIVSAIPGLLVALQLGPQTLLWTLIMYVAVQQVEGNLIYPFIQRRAVNLPPFLTLLGVMTFGVLLGGLGVVLATPLLVVIFTLTRKLYLQGALGEDIEPLEGTQ